MYNFVINLQGFQNCFLEKCLEILLRSDIKCLLWISYFVWTGYLLFLCFFFYYICDFLTYKILWPFNSIPARCSNRPWPKWKILCRTVLVFLPCLLAIVWFIWSIYKRSIENYCSVLLTYMQHFYLEYLSSSCI